MSKYAYIFTMLSGVWALIQILQTSIKYKEKIKGKYAESGIKNIFSDLLYAIKNNNAEIIYPIALVLVLVLSVYTVYTKVERVNERLKLVEMSDKIEKYNDELSNLKANYAEYISRSKLVNK